ncbi:ABC transporter permease subunit [Microlunatus speluncae]|uniref:ABC transporter permease subunit n=1 Tax=Microlunatus speluncae TaxID=2594267 RepID=UPI00126637A9|nr:ABC transporter permease subunit [Microlunatus speluncae]
MATTASAPEQPLAALPVRAELRRQLRRRRTIGIFIVLALLPLVLVAAFALGGGSPGSGPNFVDLAQNGAANLTVFTLFAATGFLLIIVVALFFGDTVPAEASFGTLRYLLAAPVPRSRLLASKLIVAAVFTVASMIFLPVWSLVVGGLAYGWNPYLAPTGDQLTMTEFAFRLPIIVGYLLLSLAVVAAFAFAFGVLTDAPLAAVGGAVLVMILSAILDQIPALGPIADALPGHFAFAWASALAPAIDFSRMVSGALWSLGYAIIGIGFAFWWFGRKDITS